MDYSPHIVGNVKNFICANYQKHLRFSNLTKQMKKKEEMSQVMRSQRKWKIFNHSITGVAIIDLGGMWYNTDNEDDDNRKLKSIPIMTKLLNHILHV